MTNSPPPPARLMTSARSSNPSLSRRGSAEQPAPATTPHSGRLDKNMNDRDEQSLKKQIERYADNLDTAQHTIAALTARVKEQLRAVEALTPGGSEFAGDFDACIRWIVDRMKTTAAIAKERNEARSENGFLQGAIQGMQNADNERIAELEAALKPFAEEERDWDFLWEDGLHPEINPKPIHDNNVNAARFTVGDLRRAAALLRKP